MRYYYTEYASWMIWDSLRDRSTNPKHGCNKQCVEKVLSEISAEDAETVRFVYREDYHDTSARVEAAAKISGKDRKSIWAVINRVQRAVARERGLC